MSERKIMPSDFAHWAAIETDRQLRARFGIGWATVLRFRGECGIGSPGRAYLRVSIPGDFARVAAGQTVRHVSLYYGRSRDMVLRWFEETGTPRGADRPNKLAAPKRPKAPASPRQPRANEPFRNVAHAPACVTRHERDMSAAGQAADYLRQFGAIYRCGETGKACVSGKFWRRGNAVLSDAELIERADYLRSRRATTAPAYSLVGNATGML